jgi:hypothetical protein
VQRAALSAYTAVARELEQLRASGATTAYQAGLEVESFEAQDAAYYALYDVDPTIPRLTRYLAEHGEEVLTAVTATLSADDPDPRVSHLPPPPWQTHKL